MKVPVDLDGGSVDIEPSDAVASPSVLSTTLLLAIADEDIEGRSAFDAGCGTGYLGFGLLTRGAVSLCGADISQEAIEIASAAADANGFSDVSDFRHGDLFEPFDDHKYGLVVSNPPQTPSALLEPGGVKPREASDGGELGDELILRVLAETQHHLQKDGILFLASSSLAHPNGVLACAQELYGNVEVIAHHELPFDAWRLRHLPYLCDQAQRGYARISYACGHPYWDIDILRCQQTSA